jgi:hypothetical protein
MSLRDINALLDDLYEDTQLQREWELNPAEVATRYALTDKQLALLLDGDVDSLIREGLAERHVQQIRVSW